MEGKPLKKIKGKYILSEKELLHIIDRSWKTTWGAYPNSFIKRYNREQKLLSK